MRIAFFTSFFPSLSITFIIDQITGMLDRGHEVSIFADRSGDRTKMHPAVERYDLLSRTHYFGVPSHLGVRAIKALGAALTLGLRRPSTLAGSLNTRRFGSVARSLRLLLACASRPDCRSFDVIICHFGPNGILASAMRDLGMLDGPVLTVFHGYDLTRQVKQSPPGLYDRLFATGDLCLPISDHWQTRLIELGCPADKIRVHRMGVDCSRFTFVAREPRPDGVIRLITIARLVEKKGVEYAIRAVAELVRRSIKVEYSVIGDGPLQGSLADLVESLGLGDSVQMLGWKREDEVRKYLEQSDILLAPSVTASDGDQEGIPMVLMEAAAMGLPVVSTYHTGIPELVKDGVSGCLVEERDVGALADRLGFLAQHQSQWAQMGREGRRFVEERFDIERLNDELVRVFERVGQGAST